MCADFDRTPSGFHKAKTYKEAFDLHSSAGGFLHLMQRLKDSVPHTDFLAAETPLKSQWMQGFLDSDIHHMLEESVPPADPNQVSAFRPSWFSC